MMKFNRKNSMVSVKLFFQVCVHGGKLSIDTNHYYLINCFWKSSVYTVSNEIIS